MEANSVSVLDDKIHEKGREMGEEESESECVFFKEM